MEQFIDSMSNLEDVQQDVACEYHSGRLRLPWSTAIRNRKIDLARRYANFCRKQRYFCRPEATEPSAAARAEYRDFRDFIFNKLARTTRERKILSLKEQGWTQKEIALRFGVSPAQISCELKEMEARLEAVYGDI
jgi:hypothetical protein